MYYKKDKIITHWFI